MNKSYILPYFLSFIFRKKTYEYNFKRYEHIAFLIKMYKKFNKERGEM